MRATQESQTEEGDVTTEIVSEADITILHCWF